MTTTFGHQGPDRLSSLRTTVTEGRLYSWIPWGSVVLGVVLSSVGVYAALAPWLYKAPANELIGDAVFSGPLSGVFFWTGIAVGPATSMVVGPAGVLVRNPLRRAWIPWVALKGFEDGFFGLRLVSSSFKMNVYACQTSNAARAQSSENRRATQIGRTLLAIQSEKLGQVAKNAGEPGHPVRRYRRLLLICALTEVALQSALMFAWAVRMAG